jgi:hypothetical protein
MIGCQCFLAWRLATGQQKLAACKRHLVEECKFSHLVLTLATSLIPQQY